jgi:hypothetical protein
MMSCSSLPFLINIVTPNIGLSVSTNHDGHQSKNENEMNTLPLSMSDDADLRLSLPAMQRAARRAREIARQTGTCNLVNKSACSYFLQKASGRFYPDFICQLKNGKTLIVEYKGANGWTDAADDRLIGGLWAAMSGGKCHFVMVKNKEWEVIDAEIKKASA